MTQVRDVTAQRIRERRLEIGMTQLELAIQSGYSGRSSINKIEKGEDDDALFCELSGDPMSETALSDSIERYNRRRGVKKTGIHRFRHTFAKLYITEIGGNALKLQKLLGHSTLDMTKHYVNLYDSDIMQGYDQESPLELLKSKQRKDRIRMR